MSETGKLAAILLADVVGYTRLAGADEDRTLSRLSWLRSDLIDPAANALEPRGDIDAVAHQVAVGFVDLIAQMNADAKLDASLGRQAGVALDEAVLHVDGAARKQR